MTRFSQEELHRILREYYPPCSSDLDEYDAQGDPAYQRTPHFERWQRLWARALEWREWDELGEHIQRAFPENPIGEGTQPYHSSCRRHIVYFRPPSIYPGTTRLTCLVAAVSVLAPLYCIYVAERVMKGRFTCRELLLPPPEGLRLHARRLAKLFERHLGYAPFPLELADVPVKDLYLYTLDCRPRLEGGTLQEAFFCDSEQMLNLP